jgi:putative ABC transport system substrate-binding protein
LIDLRQGWGPHGLRTGHPALVRGAAEQVDKILRGTSPGDIPVEEPTKFDLIINLKTAEALGLDVPMHLQQLADEVIE